MNEPLMRIGEIAAFFGVSVKAVRVYEKKGILHPAKTDGHTGYRYYTTQQVEQLSALLGLKHLGFSLSEIKALMSGGMPRELFMEALARKKKSWQDAAALAESKAENIDRIMDQLSTSKPAAKLHELTEEERAWLLAKMVCVEDLHAQSQLSAILWL